MEMLRRLHAMKCNRVNHKLLTNDIRVTEPISKRRAVKVINTD
jgi:hypothetical protein